MQNVQSFQKFIQGSQSSFKQIVENRQLAQNSIKNIKLVYGNESADLDSCIGSTSLAYFYQLTKADREQTLYIPILNCEQNDINARFEFASLMQKYNIDLNTFIYKDNFNLQNIIENIQKTHNLDFQIILYDHNKPSLEMLPFKQYVTEIVDHHADETDQIYEKGQLVQKDVKLIGSATSIISGYFKQEKGIEQVLKDNFAIVETIHATILLDTYNFDQKLKGERWTDEDTQALKYIESLYSQQPDSLQVFKELQALKFSVKMNQQLGATGLLRKDYKSFLYQPGEFGYSAITIRPQDFFQIKNFKKDISEFIAENKLAGLFLLFVYPKQDSKDFGREFVFISENNKIRDRVLQIVQTKMQHEILKYQELDNNDQNNDIQRINFVDQYLGILDVTSTQSRKLIEPWFREIKI